MNSTDNLLFKYMGTELTDGQLSPRLGFLQDQLFRFTQPSLLNDPLEARPRLYLNEYAPEDYEFAKRKAAENGRIQFEGGPSRKELEKFYLDPFPRVRIGDLPGQFPRRFPELRDEPFQSMEELDVYKAQKTYDRLLATIDRTFGVFSLSADPTSLPMWAHYGANHAGLVVAFDRTHSFFRRGPLVKLEYDDHQIGLSAKFGWIRYAGRRLEEQNALSLPMIFRKTRHWSYEQEWRLVRRLSERSNEIHLAEPPTVCLFEIPSSAVRQLILGYKIQAAAKAEIQKLVISDKRWHHVGLFQTRIDYQNGKLDIVSLPKAGQFDNRVE